MLSNDSQIISGSSEGFAVIWDLVDCKEIKRLRIGNVVHSIATHPTSSEIIFAKKCEIQLWGLCEIV